LQELLRLQFYFKQYTDLEVFREAVDKLIDNIPKEGRVIDLQLFCFGLTLDITTAFLFGKLIQSLKAPELAGKQKFAESFNIVQEYIAKRLRLLDLYWLIRRKKFQDTCNKVYQFADQIIDCNLLLCTEQNKKKKYVFLYTVAKNTLDRTVLKGQIINILVAGRDTTACLLL
jgi:cytochrome P450